MYIYIYSPPLGLGPLGPRIDWASRGTFAVLASELNCKGNRRVARNTCNLLVVLLRCARIKELKC